MANTALANGGLPKTDFALATVIAKNLEPQLIFLFENDIKTLIQQQIDNTTGRGSGMYYGPNGRRDEGSLHASWTVEGGGKYGKKLGAANANFGKVSGGIQLCGAKIYFDESKMQYNRLTGRHITPKYDGLYRKVTIAPTKAWDLIGLLEKGGGGMFYGPSNPTRTGVKIWQPIQAEISSNINGMIRRTLRRAGLKVL